MLSDKQINIAHPEALDNLEHEHVELSLEHLELYHRYLKRLPIDESSALFTQHAELLKMTDTRIKEHPTFGTARSGDVEGDEHKHASILKTPIGRRRQTGTAQG